jgi:hypothetical protein
MEESHMIITFCGHSDFTGSAKYEQQILTFLNDTVGMQEAEIYLGNYGNFDRFSYSCCKKYIDIPKHIAVAK